MHNPSQETRLEEQNSTQESGRPQALSLTICEGAKLWDSVYGGEVTGRGLKGREAVPRQKCEGETASSGFFSERWRVGYESFLLGVIAARERGLPERSCYNS